MPIIEVKNLTKEFKIQKRKEGFGGAIKSLFNREYDIRNAVDNISFEIEKGETVGYIGPNGAGKSTTIKMLVGILQPSSGVVRVNGRIPYKNRIENARGMGVVFGQRTQLWWDIPVSESLNLMKYMYKIPEDQFKENMGLFSEILEINQFMNTPVRQLSLGQRMRADLCASLLHNPDILYLDEPTIGLDVVVKENIREFIREINSIRKTTVILTTHDMSDIEKLCSRVMVVDKGSVVYDGSLQKLRETYGTGEIITIEVEGNVGEINELYKAGVESIKNENNNFSIIYDRKSVNSAAIVSWFMNKSRVTDFVVNKTDIEEVIRRMYKSQSANDDQLEVIH